VTLRDFDLLDVHGERLACFVDCSLEGDWTLDAEQRRPHGGSENSTMALAVSACWRVCQMVGQINFDLIV